jgi:asparagine synthetase B (glutamine-hydrolysing)
VTGGAGRRRLLPAAALVWRRNGSFRAPASWPAELRETVRRIDLGGAGAFFLAADGLDAAEHEALLVARMGGLRSPGGTRLSAADLLARRLVAEDRVALGELTGAGLAWGIGKRAPRFAAASTFFALPQLHYVATAGGFAAATEPRLLLPLLDRVEIDERSVPAHFLFRFVPGESTYFAGVRRLFPGSLLVFDAGEVRVRRARTLRDLAAGAPRFAGIDPAGVAWLDGEMGALTEHWVAACRELGHDAGNLLSGGLDSSLVQAWLNDVEPPVERRSWSFEVPVASFAFEARYAREASALLGTRHKTVRVDEASYLETFDRAIDLLAEPTLYNEGWCCQLAVADALATDPAAPRALFAGNGADAIHGVGDLMAISRWLELRERPDRLRALRAALPRLRSRPRSLPWVEAVEMEEDPRTFLDPTSLVSIAGELAFAVPAFGAAEVLRAFEHRRELEQELYGSDHLLERVQMLDLVTSGYDPTLAMVRLYAARGIDVVQLYLDEAAIAAPFAFPAEVRYARATGPWSGRLKPLQQEMLLRRGLGALVGRKKGGTNFNADLWSWLTTGILRERVEAIERPAWLAPAAFAEMKGRWTDFLWNLLVFDTWKKRVVDAWARAHAEEER